MFKIGDKVVRTQEGMSVNWDYPEGKIFTVTWVSSSGAQIRADNDGTGFSIRQSRFFKLVEEEVPEGTIRLRVLTGIGVLRQGSVVTVKNESESSFLLHEHPGKRYKKDRFERIVKARPVKVGDRLKCINHTRATGNYSDPNGNPWGSISNLKKGFVVVVNKLLDSSDPHDRNVAGFIAERAGYAATYYYPLDAFVHEDGTPIAENKNVPAKKPEPPKVPSLTEALKYDGGGSSGSCGYVILDQEGTAWRNFHNIVCYGSWAHLFGNTATARLGITTHHMRQGNFKLKSGNEEHAERWIDYVINRSPWADCFIKDEIPDVKTGIQVGFEMNVNKGISSLITAAIAVRDSWEHQWRLKVFTHFVDEGFSEHTAYIMAFCLQDNDGKFVISPMSDSHTNMSGNTAAKDVFKFFREGYHVKRVLEEKVLSSGPCSQYIVSQGIGPWIRSDKADSLYQFIHNNVKAEIVGTGWDQKKFVSLEAANELAAIIEKEITK